MPKNGDVRLGHDGSLYGRKPVKLSNIGQLAAICTVLLVAVMQFGGMRTVSMCDCHLKVGRDSLA